MASVSALTTPPGGKRLSALSAALDAGGKGYPTPLEQSLRKYDTNNDHDNNDGVYNSEEVRRMVEDLDAQKKEADMLKKVISVVIFMFVVLCGIMLAVVLAGNESEMSKESHVKMAAATQRAQEDARIMDPHGKGAVDVDTFRHERVIRGLFKQAEFVRLWGKPGYLRSLLGNATVRVEVYSKSVSETAIRMAFWERGTRPMRFGDFLDELASPGPEERVYMANCDVGGIDSVWLDGGGCMSAHYARSLGELPAILPEVASVPEVSKQRVLATSLFIGNGSATQYHYDDGYAALIVQVVGEKRFVLVPAHATEEVGQLQGKKLCRFADSNSSQPPAGPGQGALAPKSSAEYQLSPGDALFVPPFWWHAVYANPLPPGPPGITLTFFFKPAHSLVQYAKPHRLQQLCSFLG